ncbi:MAG: ImmA/IrrE family metallo-endopeptidase, partial [Clostridiales bacterium]|nr:ImmA/IrrE family metallo-endopeptidase [Clostridiales bacterium]
MRKSFSANIFLKIPILPYPIIRNDKASLYEKSIESGSYGTTPFVTVNRDFPDDRVRFTAAHELGHLLCGFPEREGNQTLRIHRGAWVFISELDKFSVINYT